MSIDVPPPRRRRQPDYGGWPTRPRITAALIALWALMLAETVENLGGELRRDVKRPTGPTLGGGVVLVEGPVRDRGPNLQHQMSALR